MTTTTRNHQSRWNAANMKPEPIEHDEDCIHVCPIPPGEKCRTLHSCTACTEDGEAPRDDCMTDGEAQANHERGVADCVSLAVWLNKPYAHGPHQHGDGPELHDHEAGPSAHSHGGWQGSGEPFSNCDHDSGSDCKPCIECGDQCVDAEDTDEYGPPVVCDTCQYAENKAIEALTLVRELAAVNLSECDGTEHEVLGEFVTQAQQIVKQKGAMV